MEERSRIWRKISSNWRIGFVIILIALMIFIIGKIALSGSEIAAAGKADLSEALLLDSNRIVALNGEWEFYWNQILSPADFRGNELPEMDSYMKVPDTWSKNKAGTKVYPHQGVATYRLHIYYPPTLKDPALRIQNVSAAYKLYANGQLITEVGKVSDSLSDYKEGEDSLILELPKNTQKLELIIQVANLSFARGGLRENPLFGSKEVLTQEKMRLLPVQIFFMGSVFMFGIYYLLLFLLQTKNKTALLFSLFCIIIAVRSLILGAAPIEMLFPNVSYYTRVYINYLTAYNVMPIMVLFVLSLYPMEPKKIIWGLVVLPTLLFNVLLLSPLSFYSLLTDYLYIVVFIQMIYILYILTKAVFLKKDNAILVFMAICTFFLTMILNILFYRGVGVVNITQMVLFGNFAVIMAMSYVQARQQANTHQKLILYNEKLLEADRLKDKIMATEMSFLHAQIKPHFLYNALSAIANVCEKDGKKAGKLIIDLAVYLRGSLEFNNLNKMTTMEKELEFVDTYFNIEQARFGDKIQLHKMIECPLDLQIPVLMLQPLVENAVRHGISKKPGGGTVRIRIEEGIDGDACIEVKDDGVGMGEKKCQMILSDERADQGVGLLNIHQRLHRLYGRGLEINSVEGSGICVKFSLPGPGASHARKTNDHRSGGEPS